MLKQVRSVVVATMLVAAAPSTAQPATAGEAPAAAATTRRARHVIVVPPGFQKVEGGGRVALVEPKDQGWVRDALATVAPADLPTTGPADLADRLEARREAVANGLTRHLALPDSSEAHGMIDLRLIPLLRKYEALDPPLFYLVTTRERLKELLKGGWEDVRFRYNRAADDVQVNSGMSLSVEGTDETLIPVLYEEGQSADDRRAEVARVVGKVEEQFGRQIVLQSMSAVQVMLLQFVVEKALVPLELKRDQEWFGLGLAGVESARWASEIIGVSYDDLIKGMTSEHPREPVKAAPVDLLEPMDFSALRREALPRYLEAMRRKSTVAIDHLVDQAGPEGVAKVLVAVRERRPADGEALVALIREVTGVDLTDRLKPAAGR